MGKEILYLFAGSNSSATSFVESSKGRFHFLPRIFIRPVAGKKGSSSQTRMFQSADKDAGKKKTGNS
jgi:hypothetical protein